ncbi:HIT domain-containing protein [Cephalotus follicularis]|uniref:HIT domain-containing protein n=1 Tax=Cephalotus follicularis TaxID=3775 RepID=A0A1Q3BS08_CEPFO|nr:HIT domain-containing protein [Cephalotus follicularis]
MATRRIAILGSHLDPESPTRMLAVSLSGCSSSSSGSEHERQQRLCDATKEIPPNDCVFCLIIRGESPSLKLYEDDMCLCFLDKNPLCHGHSLIIPKSHFDSLEVTPPHVIASMCSKVPLISRAIMNATGCESFNLLVNNGVPAGQVIFHTHIHIIPRKACDCLWTSESFRRRRLKFDQEAFQLADRVREQFLKISGDSDKGQEPSLS